MLEFVEGSKLYETNNIINTNHRSYVIDLNIEQYFEVEIGSYDKIDQWLLNLNKRSYRERFQEYIEGLLNKFLIEVRLDHACTNQEL